MVDLNLNIWIIIVNVNRENIPINLLILYDWIFKILKCTCLKYKSKSMKIIKDISLHTKSKQVDIFLDHICSKTNSSIWDKGEHFINVELTRKMQEFYYALCIY